MMRGFAALMCWLAWAATAVANPFPALYSVTGVAPDDVLNIRAMPDAGSELIGSFAPDAKDIEVLAIEASGKWAMVSLPEQIGWIALRFVNPQPANEDYTLTPNLQCS